MVQVVVVEGSSAVEKTGCGQMLARRYGPLIVSICPHKFIPLCEMLLVTPVPLFLIRAINSMPHVSKDTIANGPT